MVRYLLEKNGIKKNYSVVRVTQKQDNSRHGTVHLREKRVNQYHSVVCVTQKQSSWYSTSQRKTG